MAFKSGTMIRPELGRTNFSGHANAAMINSQALQHLANTVGSAILANQQKKEQKQIDEQAANMIFEFSKTSKPAQDLGITDLDTAKIAVKSLGGGKNTLEIINRLNQVSSNDRQTEALSHAISTNTNSSGRINQDGVVNSAIASGVSLPLIKRYLELENIKKQQEPDIFKSINVGDFNVLLKNGKLAQSSKRISEDEDKLPAGVLRMEYVQKKMKEARSAYNSGDPDTAFNILTSIGIKSPWTGGPLIEMELPDILGEQDLKPSNKTQTTQSHEPLIGFPNNSSLRNQTDTLQPIEIKNRPIDNSNEKKSSDIIDITSREQAKELPSGQLFRYNGKTYRRK